MEKNSKAKVSWFLQKMKKRQLFEIRLFKNNLKTELATIPMLLYNTGCKFHEH